VFPRFIVELKKLTKAGSSGASLAVDDGSRGPSITAIVGLASNSSNSLFEDEAFGFWLTLEYALSILSCQGTIRQRYNE
jgi:hypothetical protein